MKTNILKGIVPSIPPS